MAMAPGVTDNKSLLEKADLALSDLISDGGYLLAAQAQKFMRLSIEEAVLLPTGDDLQAATASEPNNRTFASEAEQSNQTVA